VNNLDRDDSSNQYKLQSKNEIAALKAEGMMQEVTSRLDENLSNHCFVAVHIGAGYHSVTKSGAYRQLCETICREVLEMLMQGCTARRAVASAVALLEVTPIN
jgi:hypothetical protein